MNPEFQVVLSALTILGAGFSVYVGVKVALAELRKDISALAKEIERLDQRMRRLEDPFFDRHVRERDSG